MAGGPMRFGVMVPGIEHVPRYQRDILRRLEDVDGVSAELLVVGKSPRTKRPLLERIRWSQLLFQIYRELLLKPEASAPVSLPVRYRNLPRIEVEPRLEGKYSEYFPTEAINEIRSYDLDFILRFSFGILRGEVLQAARYGVWSFHHDDERRYRGGPPAFWEVYHGNRKTGYILQRLTEELDGGIILARDRVSTVLTSYEINLSRVLFASRSLPIEVCRRICKTGEAKGSPSRTQARVYSYPSNGQFLSFCGKILIRRLKAATDGLRN